MPHKLDIDVLIVGGGIAGLWLNARLRRAGYATVLVERAALGGAQTLKSQGIIHGGIKYALHGALSGAAQAISDMPRRWRAALAGQGELDLSGVPLLSEAHYLWSPATLTGNLAGFFASKALRSRVEPLGEADRPGPLRHPGFKGRVYRLDEPVVDVPALLERLAGLAGDSLLAAGEIAPLREGGELRGLLVDGRTIRARRTVLCAGQGNAGLLAALGLSGQAMQTRPLHMVMLKAPNLEPLYAHCLGQGPKPRLTVTSHPAADGQWVWYLGGELAEARGVARDASQQIEQARRELAELLPWVDTAAARWTTLRVDRAEPAQIGQTRPDSAFLAAQGQLLVAWPSKLALAPELADRVVASLTCDAIHPAGQPPLPDLPRPPQALPPWKEWRP